jgi:glycosyltransferase involved in cell wall biosynthesis
LEGHDDPASPVPERHHRPSCRIDPAKIHVIHTGIDTQRFQPQDPSFSSAARSKLSLAEKEFIFGVVGTFDLPVGKGQRVFLKAAQTVMRRLPKARFLLAGSGTMDSLLREDIRHLGLSAETLSTPPQYVQFLSHSMAQDMMLKMFKTCYPELRTDQDILVLVEKCLET